MAGLASAADVMPQDGWVVVNEVLTLRMRTRTEAATAIVQRLRPLPDASKFVAEKREEAVVISSGTSVILTVTPEEARAQNSDAMALAQIWARRLEDAFALPPLKSNTHDVLLAIGQTTEIPLVGRGARQAQLVAEPAGALRIERRTGIVRITASSKGNVILTAKIGNETWFWRVNAAPWAVKQNTPLQAQVTGTTARAEVVAAAAAAAVQSRFATEPGAMIRLRGIRTGPLSAGNTGRALVDVLVHGMGLYPWTGTVDVRIQNISGRRDSAEELWYSNEPENLRNPQTLYSHWLTTGRPARLLTHQRNRGTAPLVSLVKLVNYGQTTARVSLIAGDGGVDQNPTLAGYRAGEAFMPDWKEGASLVLQIPPGSSVPVQVHELEYGDTSSGLYVFHLLEGAPDSVMMVHEAVAPASMPPKWREASRVERPYTMARPETIPVGTIIINRTNSPVFPEPKRVETFNYEVGGRITFLRLGQRAVTGNEGEALLGNFGVVYELNGTIKNPTDRVAPTEVVFESSAGYTGALIFVNGTLMKIPLLQPKTEHRMRLFNLQPGQTVRMNMVTIPLSGGSYPATITIRPVE